MRHYPVWSLPSLLTGIKDIEVLIAGCCPILYHCGLAHYHHRRKQQIKFDGALATILSAFFGLGMVIAHLCTKLKQCWSSGTFKIYIWTGSHHISARCVHHICSSAHHHRVNRIILEGASLSPSMWNTPKHYKFRHFHPFLYRSLLIVTIIIGIQSVGAILISSLPSFHPPLGQDSGRINWAPCYVY